MTGVQTCALPIYCVTCVTVIDETLVRDPVVVEGDPTYLAAAVAASDDGQPWPSWRFGY